MEIRKKDEGELRKLGVQTVYLFGSRALGQEGPLSDFDYAVLLHEKGHHRGDDLYFRLYDLFDRVSGSRKRENDAIDIIYLRDVGLELRLHVIRYGQLLFDVDPMNRLRFETETTLLYCDFRPILDQFDRTILQSL